MSTPVEDRPWRRVLDGAFRHDDDDWHLGDGGEWLLDLLVELMHPGVDVPAAVTDEQLVAALDRLDVRAE